MTDDLVRFVGAVVSSLVVVGLIISVAGPRWHVIPPRTRRVSIALMFPFVELAYGFWYAAVHDLPLHPPTFYLIGAMAVPVVAIFYGIRSGR